MIAIIKRARDGSFLFCPESYIFYLNIGDGELADKEGNQYFIHCEYNCDNGMWHYIFEIWFENDSCSIYDIPEPNRSEYLSETEIEELRAIIYNLCKDNIVL